MNRVHIHRPGASRRAFLGSVAGASAGTVLGAGLFSPRSASAVSGVFPGTIEGQRPNPIPGGVAPFAPFGVFIHHNPLNPAKRLSALNDPNQITDFNGFVGSTHIRGAGTGTDTATGAITPLAYQADMGFSQGEYIGQDGHQHVGTFVFV